MSDKVKLYFNILIFMFLLITKTSKLLLFIIRDIFFSVLEFLHTVFQEVEEVCVLNNFLCCVPFERCFTLVNQLSVAHNAMQYIMKTCP